MSVIIAFPLLLMLIRQLWCVPCPVSKPNLFKAVLHGIWNYTPCLLLKNMRYHFQIAGLYQSKNWLLASCRPLAVSIFYMVTHWETNTKLILMDLFVLPIWLFSFGKLSWCALNNLNQWLLFSFFNGGRSSNHVWVSSFTPCIDSHCFGEWSSVLCVSYGLEAMRI